MKDVSKYPLEPHTGGRLHSFLEKAGNGKLWVILWA